MRKKIASAALLFLGAIGLLFGQGSRKDDIAFKNIVTGMAAAGGALITACTSAGAGVPCTPLATIYSDLALTTPATNITCTRVGNDFCTNASVFPNLSTNPFKADANGNYGFYVTPGRYFVSITDSGSTGVQSKSLTYTFPCDPTQSCTVTGAWTSTAWAGTFTGTHITPVVFPALSGSIRLANSDPIVGRNSSNNGDESIISLGTPDEVVLGQVGLPTVVEGGILRGLGNFTITNEPILGTGNGSSITVLAVNGVGAGSHTGGSVTLTPGNGNNGGANGTVGVTAGYYFFPPAFTNGTLGTPSNGAVVYCSDCTIANPCAGGGAGAIAKRLSGAWVCN